MGNTMRRRKRISGYLALTCAAVLTACGTGGQASGGAAAGATSVGATSIGATSIDAGDRDSAKTQLETTPGESAAAGMEGELNLFVHTDGFDITPVINKLQEENPNLKIQVDQGSGTQYETILKTKLSAGEIPDIMTVWPGSRTSDYAEKGYLEPLTDQAWAGRIPTAINQEFSSGDDLYAMCFTVGGEGMFYNQDLFDQYGLDIPKDFEELKEVCRKFKENGVQPFSSGFKDDWVIMRYTNSAFATLGYGREPDFDQKLASGDLDFSYPGWVELFDKYKILLDGEYFGQGILSTDSSQAIADFATGKTAMLIHTARTIREIRKASPDMKVGFTALPVNEPGEELYGLWKSSLGLAVSRTCENKAAAKRFLELWTEKAMNEELYRMNSETPVLNDVPASGVDPAIQEFCSQFVATEKFGPAAHALWPAGMSNNWKKKLQEFVGGQITTQDMIDWLNEEYNNMK